MYVCNREEVRDKQRNRLFIVRTVWIHSIPIASRILRRGRAKSRLVSERFPRRHLDVVVTVLLFSRVRGGN
eukprot:COSAG02_NODE_1870_length_10588_cov_78.982652_1_plen_70_part_10